MFALINAGNLDLWTDFSYLQREKSSKSVHFAKMARFDLYVLLDRTDPFNMYIDVFYP